MEVKKDIDTFISAMEEEEVNTRDFGLIESKEESLERLKNLYQVGSVSSFG